MKELLTLSALLLFVALGWWWFSPPVLRASPDISLLGIDGTELRLADYRGRPLLVTFWATTCAGCLREIPHLSDLYRELGPRGLEIIGIAMYYDPPDHVLAMRDRRNIPYPIALDIHADAARAFGDVRITPSSFLIAPDGRIVYHRTGELDPETLRSDIIELMPRASLGDTCRNNQRELLLCSG